MRRAACQITIRGVVQGVGFRPFVYRSAQLHHVCGWVLNDVEGVEVHAEGAASDLTAFIDELRRNPPPAAVIADFAMRDALPQGYASFEIRDSRHTIATDHGRLTRDQYSSFEIRDSRHMSSPTVRISPDLAVCEACLRELNDSADRRQGYPYINCTNCGPRYSIILGLPYDRANTTMAAWRLCPRCLEEYEDPLDRRYHAQPTACEVCGPGYLLIDGREQIDDHRAAVLRAAQRLQAGAILAIKGIGGYHLACDAKNRTALAELRTRKFRKEKPFALMPRNLEVARQLADLSAEHERLLVDRARPIVLAPAKKEWPAVAPDNASLGIMLPYAPLHHLLFEAGAPELLVLTSANRSSEPIAYRDNDAQTRLTGIADAFLIGQRPIARRVDDSVVAVRDGRPFMVRRARGYAPSAVCHLPSDRPILALGADLKNAVTLVVAGQAFVSQHLGDLDQHDTAIAFAQTVGDLLTMYEVDMSQLMVVHDMHPQFVSRRFAATLPAAHHAAVQHHEAHIASVLAEHGLLDEPAVGVAFDGTGYGRDGAIWGGEFFVGSVRGGFERRAWLRTVMMPGGDAASRLPIQAAAGYLAQLDDLPDMTAPPFSFPHRFTAARALVAKNVRCHVSSSMGRLFDTVAALIGFTRETSFEGQAAIWLEHQARRASPQAAYPFDDLDWRRMLTEVIADRLAGRDPCEIAAAFHAAVADATVECAVRLCRQAALNRIAFSGGVFQNDFLWELLRERLATFPDIQMLTNSAVPANDGGVSLGQAAVIAGGGW